jgi:lysophospholipase
MTGEEHWVEAADGVRVRAVFWPGGPRGTVLLLGGWKDYAEKYEETAAALTGRGFAVWTMDWRGQGASTRLLPDRLKSYVGSFDDFLDDLDRVLDRLVLPGHGMPLLLMGHSMGGHLAARALARRPVIARAVLVAPMIEFLRGSRALREAARLLAEAVCLLPGAAQAFGPGPPRAPLVGRPFHGNRLTGCPVRYAEDNARLLAMPAMQLGGVTWGWLRAALRSVAVLRQQGFAEAIGVPVLVLLAGDERIVENAAARSFAARLPRGEVVEFPGARHELLREHDAVRDAVWAAVDRFLGGV